MIERLVSAISESALPEAAEWALFNIPGLAPWTWASLSALFATGSIFVIARPARYFYNPVAGVKLLTLTLASILTFLLVKYAKKQTDYWESSELRVRTAQFISLLSIALWVITILAGRWIAYLDYLI